MKNETRCGLLVALFSTCTRIRLIAVVCLAVTPLVLTVPATNASETRASPTQQPSASRLLKEMMSALKNRQIAVARNLKNELVKQYPGSPESQQAIDLMRQKDSALDKSHQESQSQGNNDQCPGYINARLIGALTQLKSVEGTGDRSRLCAATRNMIGEAGVAADMGCTRYRDIAQSYRGTAERECKPYGY